jgi:hypothetical protein
MTDEVIINSFHYNYNVVVMQILYVMAGVDKTLLIIMF